MIDPIYKIKFYQIWLDCMRAGGFSSAESREYATMILREEQDKLIVQNESD